MPPSDLYPQILGDQWHALAESVRRLHDARGIQAVGTFGVQRGNRFARLIACLMRLPAEGADVDVRLTVTPAPECEAWRRLFAATPFQTLQCAKDGFLVERVGPSETYLKLEVLGGALHYRTQRVALRLGPLRLPLPRWLAPRVTASETSEGAAVRVHVKVALPLVGLLIAYDGVLTMIETMPC